METVMNLVIGGAYQGKLAFAQKEYQLEDPRDWADGEVCSREELFSCRGINHFHLFVRRMLEAGEEVSSLAEELLQRNPRAVVVTTELGCGVVPVEAFDRNYRESCGRLCTRLAEASSRVHRVICGVGTVIKDA